MVSICKKTLKKEILFYSEKGEEGGYIKGAVQFLEQKNIVISTEWGSDYIAVRPNFNKCRFDDIARHFCWCKRKRKL